jgi:hypothetical protein
MAPHEWRLGKYIVGTKLGGGMTSVHQALNTETQKAVVLKLVAESDSEAADKIRVEERGAEIQKRLALKDRRIPKVFEWGRADGYFYVEMEYVNGVALDKGSKLGSEAVTIAIDVCEVLELAHSEQITHGDIKPGNILHVGASGDMTQRTEIKVLDFGVARSFGSATHNPFRSPDYCSPEVRAGDERGPQDDLWSLCVTIYQLVEQCLPFKDDKDLRRKITGASELFPHDSKSPQNLRHVVQKMFRAEPAARYQTAAELKADLQAFRDGKPVMAATDDAPTFRSPVPPTGQTGLTGSGDAPAQTRRVSRSLVGTLVVLSLIGATVIWAASVGSTVLAFVRAADAGQVDDEASIVTATTAYKDLDTFAGIPRLVARASGRPAKLRELQIARAQRIFDTYMRELDLPVRGSVSEREWLAVIGFLEASQDISPGSDVTRMLAYAKGQYHRINAVSRMGIAADTARKLNEKSDGVAHYGRAEEYFNEALKLDHNWIDARLALVRLYATVFPEMDKAELELSKLRGLSGEHPLRLSYEMGVGHHQMAKDLNLELGTALKNLERETPGAAAEVSMTRIRADLDALHSHLSDAMTHYDSCLSKGSCWDARDRINRAAALLQSVENRRQYLELFPFRFRIFGS